MKKISLAIALFMMFGASIANAQWSALYASASYGLAATDRDVSGVDYLDAYVIWTDGSMRVSSQQHTCYEHDAHPICGPLFGAWVDLGTPSGESWLTGPSAVGWGTHREVFAVGFVPNNDNTNNMILWHNATDSTTWSGWQSLGAPSGGLCSLPSAVSWGAGRIDVFALGCSTYNLWHTWEDSNGWHGWEIPAGSKPIYSEPVATALSTGIIQVVANGSTGTAVTAECYDGKCNNGAGSWIWNTTTLGSCNIPALADPDAFEAQNPYDRHAVLTIACGGTGQELQALSYLNGWSVYPSTINTDMVPGGTISSALHDDEFGSDVYFRNTGNNIEYVYYNLNGGWSSGGVLGVGPFAGNPVAVASAVAYGNSILVLDSAGNVWYAKN